MTLTIVAAVVSVLGVLHYRATVPFDTVERFIGHIHAHRIDDAKAMIATQDLNRLPTEYWHRLANTQFNDDIGWSMSYTSESLLHSVVVFWINVPDGEGSNRDSSVQYYASGRLVTVHETYFPPAVR